MKLNISKTKCLVICSKHAQRRKHRLCVSLNGADIEQVKEARLIGVTVDETLSWATHINNILAKMSIFLTGAIIKEVPQSLVSSHIDYCPVIWSSASKQDTNNIQFSQNRAAKLALHCTYRCGVEITHDGLSWMKVNEKLAWSLILFLNSIYTLRIPNYLLPQLLLVSDSHNRHTRRATTGYSTLPKLKTDALKKNSNV